MFCIVECDDISGMFNKWGSISYTIRGDKGPKGESIYWSKWTKGQRVGLFIDQRAQRVRGLVILIDYRG